MHPLSAVYGQLAAARRVYYERHPHLRRRLAHPVVSVGNLVVGGSGKTPVVAALAELLAARGRRPAILSRGYGRRERLDGVLVVSDSTRVIATASQSGDEPQLLALRLPGVPVLVSSDRHLAGVLAEKRFGADVLILDDGFQHVQLERTVDLLLVSPADLRERVLPAGRLREPLSVARRADAVLVQGTPGVAGDVARALGIGRAFTMTPEYAAPRLVGSHAPYQGGRAVVAMAGIARPERFFTAAREQGYEVRSEIAFRDHHWFGDRDLERAQRAAIDAGADAVLTTEKDAVRLDRTHGRGRGTAWVYLPMSMRIDPAEEFERWLAARL